MDAFDALTQNERQALLDLKKILEERFRVLDYRVFGSKARGDDFPDSDIDVMIEIEDHDAQIEAEIDDVVFEINLAYGCQISTVIFGRKELEEGPLGESPLYRVIQKEGLKV